MLRGTKQGLLGEKEKFGDVPWGRFRATQAAADTNKKTEAELSHHGKNPV